jgi:hypothetical protein
MAFKIKSFKNLALVSINLAFSDVSLSFQFFPISLSSSAKLIFYFVLYTFIKPT